MRLTVHRGSREIGGSCVELCAGDTRIILDVGMPLVRPDGARFTMRDYSGLSGPQLVEHGVLPRIEGLYQWDSPSVAGVLISHAHQDHHGFLGYVHKNVPVHMSAGTRTLMEISAVFMRGQPGPPETTQIFAWPSTFTIGAFKVTPHLVDHSASSAFAFEVEADGKRVLYSGDFREHGYLGKALDALYATVCPGVDVLLLEGTVLGRETEGAQTEKELSEQAADLCKQTDKAVFVFQSGQNISRAVSFFKAARSSDRLFIPDIYMAHLLREIGRCPGGDKLPYPGKPGFDIVRVWFPSGVTGRFIEAYGFGGLEDYQRHKISPPDMAKDLGRVMMFVRPRMERHLENLDKKASLAGSMLIYSLWRGYREERSTSSFLEAAKALGIEIKELHTSGHADTRALRRMVDTLAPRRVIPIHTFYPEGFREIGIDTRAVEDGQAIEV